MGIDTYLDCHTRELPHQALGYRTPGQVFEEARTSGCIPDLAIALSSGDLA